MNSFWNRIDTEHLRFAFEPGAVVIRIAVEPGAVVRSIAATGRGGLRGS